MGAGKSTVAAEVAEALGVQALDSDALLEERLGHPIAEEFERNGEAVLPGRRGAARVELLTTPGPGSVIALGGGSVCSERVRARSSRT